jgi:hypothetical protein
MDLVMHLCFCLFKKRVAFVKFSDDAKDDEFNQIISLTDLHVLADNWRDEDYREVLEEAYQLFQANAVLGLCKGVSEHVENEPTGNA